MEKSKLIRHIRDIENNITKIASLFYGECSRSSEAHYEFGILHKYVLWVIEDIDKEVNE